MAEVTGPGVGTAPAMPGDLAQWQGRITNMRAQGVDWDTVGQVLGEQRQKALDAGISPDAIHAAMGYTSADPAEQSMWDRTRASLEANPPKITSDHTPFEAFWDALKGSSGGLMVESMTGQTPTPDAMWANPTLAQRVFSHAGGFLGDLPAMAAGGAAGALASGGNPVVAGAGAMALPAMIRAEYSQAFIKGQVTGPGDFAARQAGVLWEGAKGAAVGALMVASGGATAVGMEALGAGTLATYAAKTSAELATMTTVAAGLEGRIAKPEEFLDNALTIGLFVPGVHAVSKVAEHVTQTVIPNLMDHWAKTGETPQEAATRARVDPTFRVDLMQPRPEEPPVGSSETPTPDGNYVLPTITVRAKAPEPIEPLPEGASAWEQAHARWEPEAQRVGLLQQAKDLGWKVYGELFDKNYPLNQLQDAYEGKVGPVADMANPKFLRRAAELSNTTAMAMIERGMVDATTREKTGPGLNDILAPFDKETGPKSIWSYALARETLANPDKPTGLDLHSAANIANDGHAKYGAAYDQLVEWRNGTLKYAVDRGYMSRDAYEAVIKEGKLPLYRAEEEGALPHAKATEGQGGASVVKERTGSELPIRNMRVSLMRDAFRRTHLGDQNAADLATAKIGAEMGVASVVRSAKSIVTPDDEIGLGNDMGGLEDPEHYPLQKLLEKKGWTFKGDEVPILRDGNVDVWRFDDPAVTNALKHATPGERSIFQKVATGFARVQRTTIVLDPLFPVRLLTYDVPWQAITKPEFRNTIAQGYHGLIDAFGDTGMRDWWLRAGGAERVFGGLSQNAYIKQVMRGQEDPSMARAAWNTVASPYRALQFWSSRLNESLRIGNFRARIDAGESVQRAAAGSSDAAFHRAGFGGDFGKSINAVQPFTLAYLNGLEQTVRGQLGIGKTITSIPFNPLKFTMGAIATITLPSIWNWYNNQDKEWYKAVPQWQKDNGLQFRIGSDGPGGTTVHIPYPPILNFLYGGLPKRLMEAFVADNPHAFGNVGQALMGTFAPPMGAFMAGTVAQPVIEKLANYSFFRGRPLNPDSVKDMLPQYQYTQYTSEAAKSLSKFLNDLPLLKEMHLTPIEIDNFVQGWAGGLGRTFQHATEQVLQAAGVIHTNAPTMQPEDWVNLLGPVTTRYPSASAQPIIDFSDKLSSIKGVHDTLDKLIRDRDLEGFKRVAQEYPAATVLHSMSLKTPPPADFGQYIAAVQANLTPDMKQAVQGINATSHVLTFLRHGADNITHVPLEEVQPMNEQEFLQHTAKMVGANPPPARMSANDKRQLLDMTYAYMQSVAERGTQWMDKAGIK